MEKLRLSANENDYPVIHDARKANLPLDVKHDMPTGFSNKSLIFDKSTDYLQTHGNGAFSDAVAQYISIINIVGVCTFVSIFGIITNVINIIVLRRQGFRETVNLSLFAIAMSDLISLVSTLWVAICYNPLFISSDILFLPLEVVWLTGDLPHVMAMNTTGWLTAFVTFERCLCIAIPLKVKSIITTARTKWVIFMIFFIVICCQIPIFCTERIGWKYDSERNKSMVGSIVTDIKKIIDTKTALLINAVGPIISFIIVAVCSLVLVVKLSQKSKWRQSAIATTGKGEQIGTKDNKVMKMILTVAVIFIVIYTPNVVIFIYASLEPELSHVGTLVNNYIVYVSFAFVFESINASANIFVYYKMSSRYKGILFSLLNRDSGIYRLRTKATESL